MKKSVFIFVFVVSCISYAQNGFYNWINHTPQELIKEKGIPAQINPAGKDSIYIYKGELGYTSFLVKNNSIFKTNNTSYWKTQGKANSALKTLLGLYQKDGFKVEKKTAKSINLSNEIYSIKLEVYYSENYYAASETATIKKEQTQ